MLLDIPIEARQHRLIEADRSWRSHDYIVVICSDSRSGRHIPHRRIAPDIPACWLGARSGRDPKPERYDFWFVVETGKTLASIRSFSGRFIPAIVVLPYTKAWSAASGAA
jgi:hypothetical protein